MKPGTKVFLTGASSGIGYALALELAAGGCELSLSARRVDVLQALRQTIETRFPGRRVHVQALDVRAADTVAPALQAAAQALGGLDIVIANAGIGSTGRVGGGHFDDDRAVIETNVTGAMATIDAAVALFKPLGRGQIVVLSSVAAVRGLPTAASYSASKAAIATYAEAVRGELLGSGVAVTTLFPGYIDTPINQDMPSRPFLIKADRGARLIVCLIERRVVRSTVPVFPWNLIVWLLRWLPLSVLAKAAG